MARTITIPGFAECNESQEAQIIARLQQEEREGLIGPSFDTGALRDALSRLTPPGPSKEELLIEDRGSEIKARQDLEADGCPPCYPPDLEIPLRTIPEEYQRIISYWQFNSTRDNTELVAQLFDWERFRDFQKRDRHYYEKTETPWSEYVDRVRERRRRNELGGDVRLRFSLEEKDRKLENWVEFQAYHIQFCIEKFARELGTQKEAMDALQEDADSADAGVSKKAVEVIRSSQPAWKHLERQLEMERFFLQWTEQQRMAMDPVGQDGNDRVSLSKALRRVSVRQKQRPTARSVLGKPGISKSQTQKRGVLRQKPKTPNTVPKPPHPAMDFSLPTSNVSRIPGSPATKPRRIETRISRRQPPPQKLSTTRNFDHANAKSAAIGQKRSPDAQSPRRSPSALGQVTTRSGRVSRPPEKWVPA